MARLRTQGWELQSAVAGMEFDGIGGVAAISTSTKRSGAAAGEIAPAGSNVPHYFASQFATSTGTGPYWLRFYLNVHTAPTTTPTTIAYLHSAKITSSATAPVASIQLTTSRTLTLWDGASQVGSASSALTADTWYQVDLKIDGTPVSGSRIVAARLNSSVFATTSASTSTLSVNWFGVGGNIGNAATTTGGDWFLDDLALNDGAAGGTETSYPTGGSVVVLRVTGAGNADFTNAFVDGDGGGGTNASKVDDSPTPDNSTTWVKRDETAGTATRGDMYTFTDPVTAGVGSGDTVTVVHAEIRGGAGANTANNARNLQARLKSKATGTSVDGSAVTFNSLTTTAWVTNGVTAPTLPCLTSYTSPHSGTAWTVTGTEDSLTSIQGGYQTQSTTGNFTNGARVSAIWLTVETVRGPVSGTAALTGGGTFTLAGASTKTGTAAMLGRGTFAATGTPTVLGTLLVSGGGTFHLAQQGVAVITGTAALAGNGTLAASGHRIRTGTLTLTGGGTAALSATRTVFGTSLLTGGGTNALTQRVAVTIFEVGGTWSAGSVIRIGGRTWIGTGALTTTATLAAAGHKVAPHGGFLNLQAAATLHLTGKRTVVGTATLAGGGTLTMRSIILPTSDRLTLDRDSKLELSRPTVLAVNG